MSPLRVPVRIVTSSAEVTRFLSEVIRAADSSRDQLGFFARRVFDDLCVQGKLWIALDGNDLTGYVAFGGRFPVLRVLQLYVAPHFRRHGIGRQLIDSLVRFGEEHGYSSIIARVADELDANAFWERANFPLIRRTTGGKARKRIINIRGHQLRTESLFKPAPVADVTRKSWIPRVQFGFRPLTSQRRYCTDMNVLMDVLNERKAAHSVRAIVSSALSNQLSLCITPEAFAELRGSRLSHLPNPLKSLLQSMPILPHANEYELRTITERLKASVFPKQPIRHERRVRNESDLKHIAYCILHRVEGFITSDKALLAARESCLEEYGIEIVSPIELSEKFTSFSAQTPYTTYPVSGEQIIVRARHDVDLQSVVTYLSRSGYGVATINKMLSRGMAHKQVQQLVAEGPSGIIGFARWEPPSINDAYVRVFADIDESNAASRLIASHFLEAAITAFPLGAVGVIEVVAQGGGNLWPELFRRRCFDLIPSETLGKSEICARKLVIRGVVTEENWPTVRDRIFRLVQVKFSAVLPNECPRGECRIELENSSGGKTTVSMIDLETAAANALFLFPDRDGLIVPVQRIYAEGLIGSEQRLLLETSKALGEIERAYFRAPVNSSMFKAGMPVIFYESLRGGGRGAAVGCARVTYSAVLSTDDAIAMFRGFGALTPESIRSRSRGERTHVFTFDNFQVFTRSVSLKDLRSLGAVSAANFRQPHKISGDRIISICQKGFAK